MGAHKLYTPAEIAVHSNSKDCWVIINAKAYNITNFLEDHPGGDEVLLAAAGKDASEEFEDVGHGSAARLMLDEFFVGEVDVDPSTYIPKAASRRPAPLHPFDNHNKSSKFMIKALQFLLFFAILGLAIAIHFYS